MWYEEQFCAVMGPTSPSDVDRFTGELNQLGKDGWDISGAIREDAGKREIVLMNKQRQISDSERVDRVIEALKSRGLSVINIQINMPNPLSDDGRITSLDHGALREIVRLVLEES